MDDVNIQNRPYTLQIPNTLKDAVGPPVFGLTDDVASLAFLHSYNLTITPDVSRCGGAVETSPLSAVHYKSQLSRRRTNGVVFGSGGSKDFIQYCYLSSMLAQCFHCNAMTFEHDCSRITCSSGLRAQSFRSKVAQFPTTSALSRFSLDHLISLYKWSSTLSGISITSLSHYY